MHFAEKAGCTFFLPGYGKKLPWGRAIFCRSQAILVMWSSVIRNKSLLLKSLKRRNAFLLHTTLGEGKMIDKQRAMLCVIPCLTLHYTHTTPHYTFSFASISSAVNFRFFIQCVVWCSVSVVSDGVLHYCKSLYIILLWWFCVVLSRNGKVKPGRIEKRGIETKKELQVKPVTLFALQDGLEPTTPWLTVRCSNQLSYWSNF